jgi:GrpB-like predicted nucleotidyltransferase (UPF0157 family)
VAGAVRRRGVADPRRPRRAGDGDRARRLDVRAGDGGQAHRRHRAGGPDPTAEADYVPPLEAIGYGLRLREPDWHEHRLLKPADRSVNLHVFAAGEPEIARMLRFRDRLRASPEDFALYLATKRELAAGDWPSTQDYADAKSDVVEEILTRAPAASTR